MTVVVVESPAKAKTINKYLGSGYTVLASYGHVRDLPATDGSVRPDDDFAMSWELDSRAAKRVSAIVEAMKSADKLVLATDPDREGEAISWHVLEILQRKGVMKSKTVERVVFNAVTRQSVLDQMTAAMSAELPEVWESCRPDVCGPEGVIDSPAELVTLAGFSPAEPAFEVSRKVVSTAAALPNETIPGPPFPPNLATTCAPLGNAVCVQWWRIPSLPTKLAAMASPRIA